MKTCGSCDKRDGVYYLPNPPKVKCTLTGEFHLQSDECNVLKSGDAECNLPRICEILGVGIGEPFQIDYPKGKTRWLVIDENEKVRAITGGKNFKIGNSIVYAVNHPESVIKKPFLTADEIQLIKAIRKLYPNAKYIERIKGGTSLGLSNDTCGWITDIDESLFQSIKPGKAYALNKLVEESYG